VAAALVEADGENVGIVVKDAFDSVAVVDVDVDVSHAVPSLFEPLDGDRRVVICAEARRS
jgi:hypothetical protein